MRKVRASEVTAAIASDWAAAACLQYGLLWRLGIVVHHVRKEHPVSSSERGAREGAMSRRKELWTSIVIVRRREPNRRYKM